MVSLNVDWNMVLYSRRPADVERALIDAMNALYEELWLSGMPCEEAREVVNNFSNNLWAAVNHYDEI